MIINDVDEMHSVVSNSNSLIWNNYDVWHIEEQPSADLFDNGVYINGKWYTRTIIPVQEFGWDIPEKFLI